MPSDNKAVELLHSTPAHNSLHGDSAPSLQTAGDVHSKEIYDGVGIVVVALLYYLRATGG
jgi:hypothetical protein